MRKGFPFHKIANTHRKPRAPVNLNDALFHQFPREMCQDNISQKQPKLYIEESKRNEKKKNLTNTSLLSLTIRISFSLSRKKKNLDPNFQFEDEPEEYIIYLKV